MKFQMKTTHYVRGTNSPHWESRAEFLVQDYTQVSLSFVIYSWNISKMADTDMLGLAMLSLAPVRINCIVVQCLFLITALKSAFSRDNLFFLNVYCCLLLLFFFTLHFFSIIIRTQIIGLKNLLLNNLK